MRARDGSASSILPILFVLSIVVTRAPFFRARRLISDDGSGRATARAKVAAACGYDYSDGKWVRSGGTDAMTYREDCPFLDSGFCCVRNGRNDSSFRHWHWQPHRGSCRLPNKFNATDMLERSRNGRIVFVGDSIGRNQWESMLCMLAAAVPAGSRIYEQFGKPLSRHKGYLSMVFADYNLSVEYYRAPMLVMVDRLPPASDGAVRRAIRRVAAACRPLGRRRCARPQHGPLVEPAQDHQIRKLFHGWRSVQRDNEHQGSIPTVSAHSERLGSNQSTALQERPHLLQELFSIALRQRDMGHRRLIRGPMGSTDDDHQREQWRCQDQNLVMSSLKLCY